MLWLMNLTFKGYTTEQRLPNKHFLSWSSVFQNQGHSSVEIKSKYISLDPILLPLGTTSNTTTITPTTTTTTTNDTYLYPTSNVQVQIVIEYSQIPKKLYFEDLAHEKKKKLKKHVQVSHKDIVESFGGSYKG